MSIPDPHFRDKQQSEIGNGDRPIAPLPNTDAIPDELKGLDQWVGWRYECRADKWTKVPVNVRTGRSASVTERAAWCPFADAVAAFRRGGLDGIGFVFTQEDPYVGIDLDGCIKGGTGVVPAALAIVKAIGSYTEISPSAKGLKIIMRGSLPTGESGRRTKNVSGFKEIEVYQHKRFFTLTGSVLGEGWATIVDASEALSKLMETYFGSNETATPEAGSALTDNAIIDRLSANKKFKKLWAGDTSEYKDDESSADSALACLIARFSRDPTQVRRIMERSGLKREKWEDRRGETDWLGACIAKALELVPPSPWTSPAHPRFERKADGMYENILRRDAYLPVKLSNFTAQLVGVESLDHGDGTKPEPRFTIRWQYEGREGQVILTSDELKSSDWPQKRLAQFAPKANIDPNCRGEAFKAAILETSPEDGIVKRRVYGRLGWFDGVGYVTGSGVINAEGLDTTVGVDLAPNFKDYRLPPPPNGDRLTTAVRASLDLLNVRSQRVTYPLLATIYGCVLGAARLTVHLCGQPGSGKTETACQFLRHFGAEFGSDEPPATWDGTANQIEGLLSKCADSPLLIDDLVIGGDQTARGQATKRIDQVVGALGNGHGRGRCDRTGKVLPPPILSGLALSTGESWVAAESRTARSIQIAVERSDLDAEKYQAAKTLGQAGVYAEAMAAFIQWCAPRLAELRAFRDARIAEFERSEASKAGQRHARYGRNTGWLLAGFELFSWFACEAGAIGQEHRDKLNATARQVIVELIERQSNEETSARPHELFCESLAVALSICKARLDDISGDRPKVMAKALGWTAPEKADRIGWVDGELVYLLPTPAHKAAMLAAPNDGIGIPDVNGLGCALRAAGLLVRVEKNQNTPKVSIPGQGRPRVWCLKLASIVDCDAKATETKDKY